MSVAPDVVVKATLKRQGLGLILMSGGLKLRSGRTLYLRRIEQWQVYAYLWEGHPTREWNLRIIQGIVEEHRNRPYMGDPLLIPPSEKAIDLGRPYLLGTPSALPGIACVASFESSSAVRDQGKDYSGLKVIWFQDEYAFPIDPSVVDQLVEIDWEKYAVDMEY